MSVDLNEPLTEIFRRLELEPKDVQRITFWPTRASAEVYKKRNGSKYIDEDTGAAATELVGFAIDTMSVGEEPA